MITVKKLPVQKALHLDHQAAGGRGQQLQIVQTQFQLLVAIVREILEVVVVGPALVVLWVLVVLEVVLVVLLEVLVVKAVAVVVQQESAAVVAAAVAVAVAAAVVEKEM